MMDGETAINYLYTLTPQTSNEVTLDLPNSTIKECCSANKIKVYADAIDSSSFKNDFSSFINICSESASAAVYKLYQYTSGWNVVATLNNNTYGTNYAFGFQQLGQRMYIGYKLSWRDVLLAFGQGIYKVELQITDAVQGNISYFSEEYKLCSYTPERVNGTVRLEWNISGTIGNLADDKQTFNFLNSDWANQIRLEGYFGYPTAEYKKEFIRYQNGLQEWTYDEQEPTYILKLKTIPAHIHNILRINMMQANRVKVCDYNANNAEKYVDKEIRFETEYKPEWTPLVSKLAEVKLIAKQRYNNYKKHRN